ncbi:AdipoR/hemolysin-III-related [Trypanosoma melophagium]|uniref:AdipoR/hemolysin-III-related n=1 Tax=Trypanosoma melophagium TaxID=715481 RepID=UPI00351A817C|nr:AdipoR/hemolysin-III-related [Trypanosoma melophagium]
MTALVGIQQVDPWLQFNPHILSGYRPRMSTRDALRSFFTLHNESFNIWSHTLAALFVLYLAIYPPRMDYTISFTPNVDDDTSMHTINTMHTITSALRYHRIDAYEASWIFSTANPTTVFRGTCLILLFIFLCSTAYHLFMPCTRSEKTYRRLMNCDVWGVLTSITGTSWSFLYYGNACSVKWSLHPVILLFALLISFVLVAYSVIFAVQCGATGRAKAIGFHLLLRLCLMLWIEIPKVQSQGYHQALNYHVLSYIFIVIGGLVNATRFPEKQMRHIPRPTLTTSTTLLSSSSSEVLLHTRTEKGEKNGSNVIKHPEGMSSLLLSRCWRWIGQYVISGEEIDYAWNSHNVWHYCVNLSVTAMLLACYYDLEEFELAKC